MKRTKKNAGSSSLLVRMDKTSRSYLAKAAKLRHISVSDYVRTVLVTQARQEVEAAEARVISLSPEDQLMFWEALNRPSQLTPAQRELGAVMRGEK